MRTIQCKYAKEVLIPQEAIAGMQRDEPLMTMDGKVCTARFISGWNNDKHEFDERLDEFCRNTWNVPFSAIRSVWIGRIGDVGGIWHRIELIER